jgi:EmrB/QacA subfamily drug resistance transporter
VFSLVKTDSMTEADLELRKNRRYQALVLSNTTLGVFMAFLNSSIVIIALPAIFRGIALNPLAPSNVSYLLWMLLGFSVASAVLVVSLGRLGDIVGRAKLFTLGFAIFTVGSVALSLTPGKGSGAALYLVVMRIVQGIGGAFLFANANAIIADTFPPERRGTALGINQVAGLSGAFIGLIAGGVLADINWRAVFIVSVPFGIFGTVWAFYKLKDVAPRRRVKIDYIGSVLFAASLILILIAISYGIQPTKGHTMSWGTPTILGELIGGVALLVVFFIVENKVEEPMLKVNLFRTRAFAAGNLANLLAAIGRGGLQFMLILWLQGIWLPLHGYSFAQTPLWAGIYLLPLTIGFLISGPVSGYLSDRFGARAFATVGMVVAGASFFALILLPVNFSYFVFAPILLVNGIGFGLFAAPNSSAVMNSVPANARGTASGMLATLTNTGQVLSIGIFFSLMIAGLSSSLPSELYNGLTSSGVSASSANYIAHLPAVASLFGAFLGFNPIKTLLGPSLSTLPSSVVHKITSNSYFPHLISSAFKSGLSIAFTVALILCLVAAAASFFRGKKFVHEDAN